MTRDDHSDAAHDVPPEEVVEPADSSSTDDATSADRSSADPAPAEAVGTDDAGADGADAAEAGPAGAGPAGAEPALPEDPTAVARQRDEYLDSLRRVQADFENYKKRIIRQQTEHLERAAEGIVTKILPALDALDLARSHHEPDGEAGKALGAVHSALYDVLAKEGLERIDPLGAEFDPNEADAVMHEPAEDSSTREVVEVLRPGYRWRGRVLRPAMVKVKG
jgi:molecular chaperone GrpE